MKQEFTPRWHHPIPRATRWQHMECCGDFVDMPLAPDIDGAVGPLTDGPDWQAQHNKAKVPGETITTWRAAVLKYEQIGYIIDDLLPRGGAYAMTGKRGSGKTSGAITLAMHVACGAPIWGRKVTRGRVMYCAGENPADVSRRLEETAHQLGLYPHSDMLLISHGVRDPAALFNEVERVASETGLFDLIIVDTHQSHYMGDDFNDNSQMAAQAKVYQEMAARMDCTVLVLSHPNRAVANKADLVPAGGGAFLNQLDGNFTIEKSGDDITLHWSEKLRAPDFAPVMFEQVKVKDRRLSSGRTVKSPTVVAKPLEGAALLKRKQKEGAEAMLVLRAMASCTKTLTVANIAEELVHIEPDTKLSARQIGGHLGRLQQVGDIEKVGKSEWALTVEGRNKLKANNGDKI